MYTELLGKWQSERRSVKLLSLQSNFYVRVRQYLTDLEEKILQLGGNDKSDVEKIVNLEMLERVKYMFNDLIRIRRLKIVQVSIEAKTMPQVPIEEEDLAKYLKKIFHNFRDSVHEGREMASGEVEEYFLEKVNSNNDESKIVIETKTIVEESKIKNEKSSDEDNGGKEQKYVMIRVIKPVARFMGGDLKPYGPLTKETVVSLPEDNAKALVRTGFAELSQVSM